MDGIVEEKTGEEGLVEALDQEISKNPNPEPGPEAEKEPAEPVEGTKTPEEIEAERIAAEEKAKKDTEDPELDLGLDEDGKTPLKLKRSQILEFKKGSMLQADYTKKTQEIAAEKANLKEVVEIIEFLKKNPAKAERIVKILEEKEAKAESKELDLNVTIAELQKKIAELPEDDPYAQGLRSLLAMNQENLKINQKLQARLDQLDSGRQTAEKSKIEAEAHQTLTEVMASKQKSLNFQDPEEAEYWKRSVLTYLVNSPKEYETLDKAQFTEYFNKIADKIHADILKIGEKHVNRYIKSKGGPGIIPGSAGAGLPVDKKAEAITTDNLQGALERELQKTQEV